jgi:hypothetical protein
MVAYRFSKLHLTDRQKLKAIESCDIANLSFHGITNDFC